MHAGDTAWTWLVPEAVVVDGPVADRCAELLAPELAAIEGADPRRRAEYSSARACARTALALLGTAPAPIMRGTDRAPRWPEGIVGSLAHTRDWCAAAVARSATLVALGIDIEDDAPLEPELWNLIATPAERSGLDALPTLRRGRVARLLFSAKEALYKCQFPSSGRFLDFADLEFELPTDVDPARGELRGTFRGAPADRRFSTVRHMAVNDRLLTAVGWR